MNLLQTVIISRKCDLKWTLSPGGVPKGGFGTPPRIFCWSTSTCRVVTKIFLGELTQICNSKCFWNYQLHFSPKFWGSKIDKIQILVKNGNFLKFRFGLKILQWKQMLRPREFFWDFLYKFLVLKNFFEVTNFFWCQILRG